MHPTLPYLLTCSDDMLIKLWDWDKGWVCTQVFEGHSHYVMQVGAGGCWGPGAGGAGSTTRSSRGTGTMSLARRGGAGLVVVLAWCCWERSQAAE